MNFIISGYGAKPQNTLALYQFDKGGPVKRIWQDSIENASFVCQGDGCLFTITEADEYASVYLYQKKGNQFCLSDQRKLEGGALCHITYSPKNKALFGACYGTGTIFSIRVEDGKFKELLYHEKQLGADPSQLSRAHCSLLNQKENRLAVTNIALDQLFLYDISDGALSFHQAVSLPKGAGPRHVIYSKDEKYLYIITEYSNEILVLSNDKEIHLIQRIQTIAAHDSGISYGSTLFLSPNGAYLYAANRGADSIAVFKVLENGRLQYQQEFDCGGKYPRHMALSDNGEVLLVCNQNSDNVILFSADADHGTIGEIAAAIEFTAPSGIIELPS